MADPSNEHSGEVESPLGASGANFRPGVEFPKTQWILVNRAREGDEASRRAAQGELLENYMPALRTHIMRRFRVDQAQADDWLQGFVFDKILKNDLISKADGARGKFRSLLLVALNRYVIDHLRARKPEHPMSVLEGKDQASMEWAQTDDQPSEAFDIEWARQVLKRAIDRMAAECGDRPELWGVFEGRVLNPTLYGAEVMDYEELVVKYNFGSPAQASNVLVTAKRMFARMLREVVSEYVSDPARVDDEVQDLRHTLAQASVRSGVNRGRTS